MGREFRNRENFRLFTRLQKTGRLLRDGVIQFRVAETSASFARFLYDYLRSD